MALSSSLSIAASINTNSLRDYTKRETLFNYFTCRKFQIVLLQETHKEHTDEFSWRKQWKGEIFNHGNRASKGVAILISNKAGLAYDNNM